MLNMSLLLYMLMVREMLNNVNMILVLAMMIHARVSIVMLVLAAIFLAGSDYVDAMLCPLVP